ncbi:glycoside hydrolase, partial [bacterium]|nr:glycoside hydrolase [bacterium]
MRVKSLPLAVILCATLMAPFATAAGHELAERFQSPPRAVGPWAYWWWLKGNVSEASITRDLEAMKAKGFSGLLMFDARGYHESHVPPPKSRMEFMSHEWRQKLRFAMAEAKRLGLTM